MVQNIDVNCDVPVLFLITSWWSQKSGFAARLCTLLHEQLEGVCSGHGNM